MSRGPTRHHNRHKLLRLVMAACVGAVIAYLAPLPEHLPVAGRVLVGYIVAALGFALPLLVTMLHADHEQTLDFVRGIDPGRSFVDVSVLTVSMASIGALGLMLTATQARGNARVAGGVIALGTVAAGWLVVNTLFAMRYARHYVGADPGCIDFNTKTAPCYSDFVYFAFAIGMSYAVSDTNTTTTAIRRIAVRHAWLSYAYGTIVVAAAINLVVTLAG
ncbi:MAG: DUF1345 domain-containing protein [Tetrasphaera sp.]